MHQSGGGIVRLILTWRGLLAVLLLSIPWATGAAGLGKLTVLSAMGEPLRAEIDLLSYQDERATLMPRLASPDIYPLVDFRYNPALNGASLNIRKHLNGRYFIEVTSDRPVNEPFIHLLVELDGNALRIVRGYTVLLDPYGYGPPRDTAATEFLPAVVAVAIPAVPPATLRAPAAPRVPRVPGNVDANAKTLAGMLKRVAALELAVQELQRKLEMPDAVAAVPKPAAEEPPARNSVAAGTAPVAATSPVPLQPVAPVAREQPAATVASLPRRARDADSILNEALLVLAGGALLMVGWLVYWMWGRPPLQK